MLTRFSFLTVASAIAVVGFTYPAPARSGQADAPVLLVTASYPGANAQTAADTVAAHIEEQIELVARAVRIESTSGNDGTYTARLYLRPKTDPASALKRVQRRVALAEPLLADVVRRDKVAVKVGKAEADPSKVAIAVIDRGDNGWTALQKVASAVVKRLAAEGALTKPQVFPRDEKQVYIHVDPPKCKALGVTPADVLKALQKAGPSARYYINPSPAIQITGAPADQAAGPATSLKKVVVRGKVTLGAVAAIKEYVGPSAVYRVNLSPAIRITGAPPEGKSVAAAAAKCVDLTQAEMKRLGTRVFSVQNLSAK